MCATRGPAETHTRTLRWRRDTVPLRGVDAQAELLLGQALGGLGEAGPGHVGHGDIAGADGNPHRHRRADEKGRREGTADDHQPAQSSHPTSKGHARSITVLHGLA
jgi:hypothetical protein